MSAGEEEEDVYPFQGFDGSNEPIGPCDKFWERVLTKRLEDKKLWYHQGVEYWNTVDATIDGVLGGFGSVSRADAKENEGILRTLVFPEFDFGEMDGGGGGCANKIEKRALDVGAGVGRVSVRDFILFAIHFLLFLFFFFFLCVCMTSRLTFSFSRERVFTQSTFLTKFFGSVDLVEPVHHFVEKAKATLRDKVQNYFEESLEEFSFENTGKDGNELVYDVIWVQWCIGQLADADFVAFLQRAKVRADGFIVVKENNCSKGFHWDDQDSSITRSDNYFRWIFEQAEMEVVNTKVSDVFPKELFPVRTYILKRRKSQ